MKRFLLFATLMLFGTIAHADGPSVPWDDPVVTPPTMLLNEWSGPYIGGAIGGAKTTYTDTVNYSETHIPEVEVETKAECAIKDDRSDHWNHKCVATGITDDALAQIPEMGWRDCKNSDNAACIIGQHDDGPWLWLNEDIQYVTGSYIEMGQPVVTTWTETFEQSLEDATAGVFAGYRHDAGSIVYGAEVAFTKSETFGIITAEATAGYDLGALLPYVSVGRAWDDVDNGLAYGAGADWSVTDNMFFGAKYQVAEMPDYDIERAEIRVGFNF